MCRTAHIIKHDATYDIDIATTFQSKLIPISDIILPNRFQRSYNIG